MSLLSSPRKCMFFSSLIQETFSRLENFNLFYSLTFKECKVTVWINRTKKKKTEPKNFNKMRQRKQEFMFQMVHTCIFCLIYITSHGVRVFKPT